MLGPPTNYRTVECNTIRIHTYTFRTLYIAALLKQKYGRLRALSGLKGSYVSLQTSAILLRSGPGKVSLFPVGVPKIKDFLPDQ